MWGTADGQGYEPDEDDVEPVPVRLRSRIIAALMIAALLAATARGGWLVFAGPTPQRLPQRLPSSGESAAESDAAKLVGPLPSVSFAVRCQLSHVTNDDPLLNPRKPGQSHRHSFFGNETTDASSTVETLVGKATSCEDPADTAAYWLPTPISAQWVAIRAYYGSGSITPDLIAAYPSGFAMIGGRPPTHHEHPSETTGVSRVSAVSSSAVGSTETEVETRPADWSCGRAIDEPGWTVTVPQCADGQALVARITFGQCARVATALPKGPTGGQVERPAESPAQVVDVVEPSEGQCPRTHPVAIVQLRIRAELSGRPTAFSSGPLDTLHADFINAWEQPVLERLIDLCIRGHRNPNDIKRCGLAGTGPRATRFA